MSLLPVRDLPQIPNVEVGLVFGLSTSTMAASICRRPARSIWRAGRECRRCTQCEPWAWGLYFLTCVDDQGKVRASISVIPEGPARRADGSLNEHGEKIFPEAVVLRLIRPDGRPSVKIATTEQGSGIDLSGGIDPTYITLISEGGKASLTLTNKDGRRESIKP
jgi:hypothetical protein